VKIPLVAVSDYPNTYRRFVEAFPGNATCIQLTLRVAGTNRLPPIHNYGIKHSDGSTAASRLFEQDFPDPLTWLLEQLDELPLPRRSKKRATYNPLILLPVPS